MALGVGRIKSLKFDSEIRKSTSLAWNPFVARLLLSNCETARLD